MSDNDAIRQLFEQIRSFKHRSEAVEVGRQILMESKTLSTPDLLLKYLHDRHWQIRQYAAEALGYFDQPEIAQQLIERFVVEGEKEVQVEIVLSLRNQKTLLALRALIEIAKDTKLNPWVRSEAAYGIAISTAQNVYDPLLETLTQPIERTADYQVIEAVFEAFDELDQRDSAIPAKLTAMLRAGTLPEATLDGAIHFLGRRQYRAAFDLILQFLDNEDHRWPAAVALGNMGDIRALPKLREALAGLNDPRDHVRQVIADAIEQLQAGSRHSSDSLH